jgi:hypothetical protein
VLSGRIGGLLLAWLVFLKRGDDRVDDRPAVNATIRVRAALGVGLAEGDFTGSRIRWIFGSSKSESSA